LSLSVPHRSRLLQSALVGFRPGPVATQLARVGSAKVGFSPPPKVPATATVALNSPTPLNGLSVASGGSNTMTLTDTNGLLFATGAGVTGAGTTSLTITGTDSQVNAALATLTDTDPMLGADTISVADNGATASIAVTAIPLDLFLTATTGDWSNAADWSLGASPGSSTPISDVGFFGSGSVATVSDSEAAGLIIIGANTSAVTIASGGVLLLGGGSASATEGSLDLASGSLTLQAGGTLGANVAGTPAVLKLDGGTFVAAGGTFNDVAVQGTLDLSAAGASLVSTGGLSVTAIGDGNGAIKLTGAGSSLEITSTETIANDAITFGGSGTGTEASTLAIDAGAALTLAGDTLAIGSGSNAAVTGGGSLVLASGSTLTDNGGLSIATAGGFENDGTVGANGYGVLNVSGPITGSGAIDLSAFLSNQVAAELGSTVAATQTIAFQSPGVTLTLDGVTAATPTAVQAGITGLLAYAGTLDLSHLAYSTTATALVAGGVLTISDGGVTTAVLNTTDVANGTTIQLAADAGGLGTLVTTVIPVAVTSDVANPATGTLIVGQTVTFTLTTAQAVNAGPLAALTLNDGGTASYVSGTGTSSLVFSATIAAGQNVATLAVTGTSGTFTDAATGENVALTGVATSFPGLVVDMAPVVTAALAADTGASATDTITNNDTLSGTGHPGAVVTVSEAGGALGTTTADASGAWSFSPSGLADGSHTLTASETDAAGNIGTATASFTLDTIAPVAPTFTTGSMVTDGAMPVITGFGEDGTTVTLLDGTTAIGTSAVSGGTWSITDTTALTDGLNVLTAIATDVAGNVSTSPSSINLFNIPPPMTGVGTADVSSADLGAVLNQGAQLAFAGGTEAILLTDATLSVGPDTNEATIQRLYEGLLGRSNDTGGISSWDAALTSGSSKSTLATAFLNSNEYLASHGTQSDSQFVTSLYQGVLGRAPDPDGAASWTSLLAQGVSRGDVALGFADSSEAKGHLADATARVYAPNAAGTLAHELYETGLGREVELTGLASFKAAYANLTPAQLAANIAGSSEFMNDHAGQGNAAYVASLYQAGLGRAPDARGAALWTGLLDNGTASRADELLSIATSPEGAAHLTYNLG